LEYWMKPKSLNLFMKELTLERVVPIISAKVSCDRWVIILLGRSCLPYCASISRVRASRFSLLLKS
jgi:hypothetical protein